MTNVSEKTIPVSAIIPEETAEKMPIAAFTLIVETRPGRKSYASRGTVNPNTRAPAAYNKGISHAVTGELCKLRAMRILVQPNSRFCHSVCKTWHESTGTSTDRYLNWHRVKSTRILRVRHPAWEQASGIKYCGPKWS